MRVEDKLAKMYGILERMVSSAQEGDKTEVLRLNEAYEKLNPRALYRKMDSGIAGEYDNCRQSCTLMGTFLMPDAEKAIKDAKERFARIPKPKKPTTLSARARACPNRDG